MVNNDILRRLRYTFNFNDKKMVSLLQVAGLEVSTDMVVGWLKKDDDADFLACNDNQLAYFLNGLIIDRRGAKEERKQEVEKRLNNNLILVKLKIALSLKSDDIIELMKETHLPISKSELGSFLRKPDHRNYKKCHDQFLRNFLLGIDKKFNVKRPAKYVVDEKAAKVNSDIYKKSASKFTQPKSSPGLKQEAKQNQAASSDLNKSGSNKSGSKNKFVKHSDSKKSGSKKIFVNPTAKADSPNKSKNPDKPGGKSTLKRKVPKAD